MTIFKTALLGPRDPGGATNKGLRTPGTELMRHPLLFFHSVCSQSSVAV